MTSVIDSQIQPKPQLPDYTFIETIYQGSRTTVYRAVEKATQQPVVIKVLAQTHPSFSELVQFRNQYTIAKNLPIAGIIHPLTLVPCDNGYGLVMEDFGGISLAQYTQHHPLDLSQVLAIAIQLAAILHDLHQHRVIHKDIKPANILIHPDSKQIKLIDFSIASLLPKETQAVQSPNSLEGTLAYLAPEQTGRMNRAIDYRTDFYALGVSLYQLLTGQLPFTSKDPLALIHSHMAQMPTAVNQVNPALPSMVAAIVAKLMAKNAEDRYQSGLGLKHDLEQCLNQWKAHERIADFILGQQDLGDRFVIPEKLYGRETEVQQLLDAFERVAQGASELMLVAGFSGIGKTAVVNEVHKPIAQQQGYFIKGKFDQFNRNIPFSAFVQAFQDLVGQLLSESDTELQNWKTQILEALGENAQVIVDLVPELESIIGPQIPAPELSGAAAQNRFHLLFQKFIQVFTTPTHTLVIFVDDLQWADSASLNLIQVLMAESQMGHLLLLGAYRDNEVFPAHPLMLTLDELKKGGAPIHDIILQSLSVASLNHLITDTLHAPDQSVHSLTSLVMQKTQGNPFFTTQFLKVLHQDQLITFDHNAGHWQCDMAQIQDAALSGDVIEFMASQLQKLPVATQEALKFAACIGTQFDLETLATVSKQSPTEVATALWKALQEGLILSQSELYKFYIGQPETAPNPAKEVLQYEFLHDRVQQAAYSLIPDSQRQKVHLQIGQTLLKNVLEEEIENRIFDIVNQLNMSVKLINEPCEQEHLAQLNLRAGRKAKITTAYTAAVDYLNTGLSLLNLNSWEDQYNLTLNIYELLAESEYLNANFEASEEHIKQALGNIEITLDKIRFYEIQIQSYTAQNSLLEAIDTGREALKLLDIELPKDCDIETITNEHQKLKILLNDCQIKDLADLSTLCDLERFAALRILVGLFPSVYLAKPSLLPLKIFMMVEICVRYGNAPQATIAYSLYGLFLCATGEFELGYEFGQLAKILLEKLQAKELSSKVNFLFGFFIKHWRASVHSALPAFLTGLTSGLENGDLEYVGYCANCYIQFLFWSGENLETTNAEAEKYCDLIAGIKQDISLIWANTWKQIVMNLLGDSEDPKILIGSCFNETETLPALIKSNNTNGICHVYLAKLMLSYLFSDYLCATTAAKDFEGYESGTAGLLIAPQKNFYQSLSLLSLLTEENNIIKIVDFEKVVDNQKSMKVWAESAPMNYLHKFQLVEAEIHRVSDKHYEAGDLYDRAIAGAKANGYIQEEALANELAAKFYLAWGKEKIAAGYMQEAYYRYTRWGAQAKVADLESRYPDLLRPILQQANAAGSVLDTLMTIASPTMSAQDSTHQSSSSTNLNQSLDFAAILKASQALSSTIQLDDLLHKLTQIILQNSGGDRCALVMPDETRKWQVRAIATPDDTQLYTESLTDNPNVPVKLIQYVKNTQEAIVIDDLETNLPVIDDYLRQRQPKSLLCMPILNQGHLPWHSISQQPHHPWRLYRGAHLSPQLSLYPGCHCFGKCPTLPAGTTGPDQFAAGSVKTGSE